MARISRHFDANCKKISTKQGPIKCKTVSKFIKYTKFVRLDLRATVAPIFADCVQSPSLKSVRNHFGSFVCFFYVCFLFVSPTAIQHQTKQTKQDNRCVHIKFQKSNNDFKLYYFRDSLHSKYMNHGITCIAFYK